MKKNVHLVRCLLQAVILPAVILLPSCSEAYFYDFLPDEFAFVSDIEVELPGDSFDEIVENDFVETSRQPVSTFSVDADGAAYAYMRRCLSEGSLPPKNSVRVEEYLNYFTFDYPDPTGDETLSINSEIWSCPWAEDHCLMRLGIKGKSIPESKIPAANFIFLVDVSGSMEGEDRLDLVKEGLLSLLDNMRAGDRVALITYSGKVRMVLPSTDVSEKEKIGKAIRSLRAGGSTAGGPAMEMAYREAMDNFLQGGNNRIIMCTDGDFNVGVTSTEALVEMIEQYLDKGIYLSIMGFGTGNLNDSRMESLSNHGNGTYNYIDSVEEMEKVFVSERSHFYSVATDTKCQVQFNPELVLKYRLIGYENRVMANEDFEDDSKDAGEIGAGQTITALYELVLPEDHVSDVYAKSASPAPTYATFSLRYKKAAGEQSRPLSVDVRVPEGVVSPSGEFSFAAGTAAFCLLLRDSKYKGNASFAMARELVGKGLSFDHGSCRASFMELIDKASKLSERD